MVRKSYIERQIEALTLALAKLLGLKQAGDYAGALAEIRSSCKRLTGIDANTLAALPDDTLLSLFAAGDAVDAGKCLTAGALLKEQADVYERQRQAGAALVSRRKALALFLEALLHEGSLRTAAYRAQVDALLARLSDDGFPAPVLHRLFRYYEAVGSYARAEDTLFALQEARYPGSAREATAFYRRLLTLPDPDLVAGGLPRDEVEEGLALVKTDH